MSRINLTDDADAIMQKVRKAKTDPEPLPGHADGLKERPEAANLVGIYAAMAGCSVADVLAQFEGQGFGAFKPALGELLVEGLGPITARYRELRHRYRRTRCDPCLGSGARPRAGSADSDAGLCSAGAGQRVECCCSFGGL